MLNDHRPDAHELLDDQIEEGVIKIISGFPLSGLYQVLFGDGRMVHLESGMGARQLESVYGSLERAIGKRIRYATDSLNVMSYFEPVEDDS